ncbi:cupin domain-containing protein [Rubinisphaera margarita]|uniref:cupin domain-containing protein n=1 Tax=Rubinisphaera margarita TaxID=2909586 RepID=UPI001EE7FCF2|nr:cupin domain-containing protein [Rubinisphaera margarita]MCG6158105.1 cupin domain-containing protein [Rubinisphaera margarita]
MALDHANPGELIELRPLSERQGNGRTYTVAKSEDLELIRLILKAGKEIATHSARGTLVVHCLEGKVNFEVHGKTHEMQAGSLLYLTGGEPHALKAVEDSSLLLTIILPEHA